MSKTKEWFMKQQSNLPNDVQHDEDYLYEQYLKEEKLNEEYWNGVNSGSIFPEGLEYDDEYYKSAYFPTQQEEDENFKQTLKQNGHTS
jgi:hypothetical protein